MDTPIVQLPGRRGGTKGRRMRPEFSKVAFHDLRRNGPTPEAQNATVMRQGGHMVASRRQRMKRPAVRVWHVAAHGYRSRRLARLERNFHLAHAAGDPLTGRLQNGFLSRLGTVQRISGGVPGARLARAGRPASTGRGAGRACGPRSSQAGRSGWLTAAATVPAKGSSNFRRDELGISIRPAASVRIATRGHKSKRGGPGAGGASARCPHSAGG